MMTREEQIKCFGDTIANMKSHLVSGPFYNERDIQMYAQGIISDAQYIMGSNPEQARQFLNKAKWHFDQVGKTLFKLEQAGHLPKLGGA